MFTDRFIKVPIEIFNKKQKELTGVEVCEKTWLKFLPFEISDYRPSYDDDYPDIEATSINLKNGLSYLVYLSPDEFEHLLNYNNATSMSK